MNVLYEENTTGLSDSDGEFREWVGSFSITAEQ
jgi:hypothetical protein